MDIRDLGRLDMNLLVALEALLEERSVSRAAQRLYITQSAMSKTLGRLRDLFDDPLFVRQGGGMIPTPRAEQLATVLPGVLQAVQAMLQPLEFEPASYAGEMRLLVQGHMGSWFIPALVAQIHRDAPGLTLSVVRSRDHYLDDLALGALDFVVHVELTAYPPDILLTTLGFANTGVLVRKGHPLEGAHPTIADMTSYPVVMLSGTALEEVQWVTGDRELIVEFQSAIAPSFVTDDIHVALQVIRESDFIFPAPPLFLEQFNLARKITALRLPGDPPGVKFIVARHRRVEKSPPHQFCYQQILDVAESFRARFDLPPLAELRRQRKLAY